MDLTQQLPLQTGNAVAAILIDDRGRYLLQLRDEAPQIWYPGHWGLFGGSVEPGEDEVAALRRELYEELELEFAQARLFTRFEFDLRPLGLDRYFRSYYEIALSAAELPAPGSARGRRNAQCSERRGADDEARSL